MAMNLNNSLCGMVQPPLYWYNYIKGFIETRCFKTIPMDPCVLYGTGMMEIIYVDDILFFGTEIDMIYEVINIIEDYFLSLMVGADVYNLLVFEVKTDKQSCKVTLTQGGFNKKFLKTVEMLENNNKATPGATMSLVKDNDGTPFDKPWEYASVVRMLMYLSRNYSTGIQFEVHQCDRFTHNPRRIIAEAVKRICRYLAGTQVQGLTFDPNSDMNLD